VHQSSRRILILKSTPWPDKRHTYSIRLDWTGNQDTGTSAYRAYSRAHEISAQSKTAMIGVISHRTLQVERPEDVAALVRKAIKHIAPERLILTSDCGTPNIISLPTLDAASFKSKSRQAVDQNIQPGTLLVTRSWRRDCQRAS
jgi:hypothetical protein